MLCRIFPFYPHRELCGSSTGARFYILLGLVATLAGLPLWEFRNSECFLNEGAESGAEYRDHTRGHPVVRTAHPIPGSLRYWLRKRIAL